jgi:hypothetical protein
MDDLAGAGGWGRGWIELEQMSASRLSSVGFARPPMAIPLEMASVPPDLRPFPFSVRVSNFDHGLRTSPMHVSSRREALAQLWL